MQKKHDCVAELRALGFRVTPGRLAVLRFLESAKTPQSAVAVAQALPALNEVTIYRILEAFAAAGLVRAGEKNRIIRYSYAAFTHHHHLICEDCGFSPQCHNC